MADDERRGWKVTRLANVVPMYLHYSVNGLGKEERYIYMRVDDIVNKFGC
jgi:hypothetical protein